MRRGLYLFDGYYAGLAQRAPDYRLELRGPSKFLCARHAKIDPAGVEGIQHLDAWNGALLLRALSDECCCATYRAAPRRLQ